MLGPNPEHNASKIAHFRIVVPSCRSVRLVFEPYASDKPSPPTNAKKIFSYIKVRSVITGLVQQPVQIVVRFAHTI